MQASQKENIYIKVTSQSSGIHESIEYFKGKRAMRF